MSGGRFVVDVAIGAGQEAFCAEGSEAFIEFATGAAEVGIVFVAEGEDRVGERFESRC